MGSQKAAGIDQATMDYFERMLMANMPLDWPPEYYSMLVSKTGVCERIWEYVKYLESPDALTPAEIMDRLLRIDGYINVTMCESWGENAGQWYVNSNIGVADIESSFGSDFIGIYRSTPEAAIVDFWIEIQKISERTDSMLVCNVALHGLPHGFDCDEVRVRWNAGIADWVDVDLPDIDRDRGSKKYRKYREYRDYKLKHSRN